MDIKNKKLSKTYSIIPHNTLDSDQKRQIIISNNLDGTIFKYFNTKQYKQNYYNQIFITDKIDFFSLAKLLFVKKNKLYSYNLELNSLSYKALSQYYFQDLNNKFSTKNYYRKTKIFFFDLIKIFFLRLNFYFAKTVCILPSKHRIDLLKNKFKIKCDYVCIKNLPVLSDLYFKNSIFNFDSNDKIKKIIKDKNYFFLNGNINNKNDLLKILKYCLKNETYLLISSNQNYYFNNIDVSLKKFLVNLGYLKNKILMYYIINNSKAGVCLYNNNNLNQIYSSSTKFYDFLVYNKLIIYSDNYGLRKEIESVKKKIKNDNKFCNVNSLISKTITDKNSSTNINNHFVFDNCYKNILL